MGRLEFYAWVHQANRELAEHKTKADSWKGAEQDDFWQRARRKRDRARGR